MRFKELGKSGIKMSSITLGTWVLGGGAHWGDNDYQQSVKTIQAALDAGITSIDTAPGYGSGLSERIVGEAVKGRRDKVVIATKCGIPLWPEQGGICNSSYDVIIRQAEECLERLGTDYIDLFQIHWPDFFTPVDETMAAMAKLKKEGKIRAIGVSNYDEAMLAAAMSCVQIDCQQPQFSLLHTVNRPILEFGYENGLGALTYGSLGSGVLTGKYKEIPQFKDGDARTLNSMYAGLFREPMWSKIQKLLAVLEQIAEAHNVPVAQVAINWTAQQPFVTAALVGARTPEQAIQNAAAGEWDLTDEEIEKINVAHQQIFGDGLLGKRPVWDGARPQRYAF